MEKRITNRELILKVVSANPEGAVAKFVGYNKSTGDMTLTDLSAFGAVPEIANEFLSDMNNLVVKQVAFDVARDWKPIYSTFEVPVDRLGDAEQMLTAELATVNDYADSTNPFGASKPSIVESWFKTEFYKEVDVRLSEQIWAGAFTTEYGLSNLVSIIVKNLEDAISIFMYEQFTLWLETHVDKHVVIEEITGAGEAEASRKSYEQILKVASDMSLPSTAYNESEVKTLTALGKGVLILNTRYKTSYDVNVMASLFNSATIGQSKYFSEVIMVAFTDETLVGMILDPQAFRYGHRIKTMLSNLNGRTIEINQFLHDWIKVAVLPFKNAVKLLTAEPVA